jgi:hypothetical protein
MGNSCPEEDPIISLGLVGWIKTSTGQNHTRPFTLIFKAI